MSIQTRLLSLLAMVVAAHLVALAALRHHTDITVAGLQAEHARDVERSICNAVAMEGRMLQNFSFDYTYWDEMVAFVGTGDRKWGEENLDVSLPVFHIDACWVYGTNFNLVYEARRAGAEEGDLGDGLAAKCRVAFGAEKFPHFFGWKGDKVVEFRGAPIHPTADADRKTIPRGYLVAARVWNEGVLGAMSSLITDSEFRVALSAPAPLDGAVARQERRTQIVRPLPAPGGARASGFLVANESYRGLRGLDRANGMAIMTGALFSIVVIAAAAWATVVWISRPVRALANALATEDASGLRSVCGEGHEFGSLARMVDGFFRQKSELVLQVRRRIEAEAGVRATNQVLQVVSRCNFALASVTEEADAYRKVVEVIGAAGPYPLVWMGLIEGAGGKRTVRIVEKGGRRGALLRSEWIAVGENPKDDGAVGRAVGSGKPVVSANPRGEAGFDVGADDGGRNPRPASCICLPLMNEGEAFALIGILADSGSGFGSTQEPLFAEMVDNVARVVVSMRAKAARLVAERKAFELTERLREAEKLEALGRLAGGIAHDFNNLVFLIVGNIDLALDAMERSCDARRELREAKGACWQAAALSERLLAIGRKRLIKAMPMNMHDEIRECLGLFHQAVPANVDVRVVTGSAAGVIVGDRVQIRQVIMNLVKNALEAMPRGGTLEIATEDVVLDVEHSSWSAKMEPGAYLLIAVRDTGVGIQADALGRLFDPFFTTKPGGTGLGLPTVHGAVTQHGGHVEVSSTVGKGSVFRVYLPAALEAGQVAKPLLEAEPRRARAGERVLLVEDGDACRRLTRTMLEALGYGVVEAPDGEEALAIILAGGERHDLVLSDVVMPRMSGRDLWERLQSSGREVKFVFMSGYPDAVLMEQGAPFRGNIDLMHKPFTLRQLGEMLRRVLDRDGAGAGPHAG